LNNIKPNH